MPYYKIINKGILLLLLVLPGYGGIAQKISTIAGNGVAGYNGDDWAATTAQLWSPAGVAVSGGNIYIADGLNNRVRKVTASGTISTVAGIDDPGNAGDGGSATDAQLNDPVGVAADMYGNIYIADKYNNRVRKVTPKGIICAFAGNGTQGYSGDGAAATAASLNAPAGLAADSAGNVYIADAGNNCIRKVSPGGTIYSFAGNGSQGFSGDNGPATAARLNVPGAIAIDTAGNVYIADSWNYRIRKVTTAGTINTIAGTGIAGYTGDGDMDTVAELNLPTGIAVDRAGNIYIADQGNNRIRRISPAGIMMTIAGTGNANYNGDGGDAAVADVNAPAGIATDGKSNLYIAEQQDNHIRRIIIPPAPSMKIVKTAPKTDSGKSIGGSTLPPPANTGGYQFQSKPIFQPSAPRQPAMYNRRKNNG